MSKKYIIELEDKPAFTADGVDYYRCVSGPWVTLGDPTIKRLIPYEPEDGIADAKCEFCTMFGYPVRDLALFAYACRENGVEEQDMRVFANNAEVAYQVVSRDMNKALERAFNDQVDRMRQADETAWERIRQREE